MAATGAAVAIPERRPGSNGNGNGLVSWKTVAVAAVGIILGMVPAQIRGSVSRADVEDMLRSGENPYITDREAIKERLERIEQRLDRLEIDTNSMRDDVSDIAIAVGVPTPRRKK